MNSSVAKPLAKSIRVLFLIISFCNDAFKLKCCVEGLNPQPTADIWTVQETLITRKSPDYENDEPRTRT